MASLVILKVEPVDIDFNFALQATFVLNSVVTVLELKTICVLYNILLKPMSNNYVLSYSYINNFYRIMDQIILLREELEESINLFSLTSLQLTCFLFTYFKTILEFSNMMHKVRSTH